MFSLLVASANKPRNMLSSSIFSWVFLEIFTATSVQSKNYVDPECPLFLTPYIDCGKISEARQLAEVPFTDKLHVRSYAGLFTVDKTYNSNHFLWYFPAIKPKSEVTPVLVWLQGGPGSTSLLGLFTENGPIEIRNGQFAYRKINWATDYHLIYIDNPVGTGYSFTNDSKGYCTSQAQISEQLYSTLIQFFKMFPELQNNPFFLTGESYAGKYVPSLAYTIHKKNVDAEIKINLYGMAIGNGYSDPENQLDFHNYLLQLGLIDSNQAAVIEKAENKVIDLIQQEKWIEAFDYQELNLIYLIKNITGLSSMYNYLETNPNSEFYKESNISLMVQETFVRKGLHVGNLTFYDNINDNNVFNFLKEDVVKSVAPLISELLEDYCVLVYSGQLDVIVAYPLTVNYLRKLNFTSAEEYKNTERTIWRVDDEVAGYIRKGGNLMEVLVRNAGHMVPADQPKWALSLINMFIENSLGKNKIN